LRGAASQKQSNPIKSRQKSQKKLQIKTMEAELLFSTENIVSVKAPT